MIFSGINDFYSKIRGKKLAFIGIGVSHEELIFKCAEKGALITLCDRRCEDKIEQSKKLIAAGITLKLGEDYLKDIDADIIFRTPGMYFLNPMLTEYRKKGVIVTSEMELFFELCPCPVYAITGSDGKTTTSNIIARFLSESGKKVFLGGNLGRALLPVCDEISPVDAAVVELSSFQLISMRQSGDISVITNVSPNHLDVHKDMNEYIDAKRNIYLHQSSFGRLILNADNEITASMADEARGQVDWFSYSKKAEFFENKNGAYLDKEGNIVRKSGKNIEVIMHKSEIKIPGEHNVENYLTAITAVGDEVTAEVIRNVAKTFAGVEHRIEFVREKNGVKFYNDSIASSPTRTIAGLKSFSQKVILIAGGYDKHISYAPLAPVIKEKVSFLITMGDTAQKIENELDLLGGEIPPIFRANDMNEAVKKAAEISKSGDIVILSPASASFDKYKNFEVRGRHFKDIVNGL